MRSSKLNTDFKNPALSKIDSTGKYLNFPGVTVICAVNSEYMDLWKAVYACINNSDLLRQYFSPLPHVSYHMTTIDLYTQLRHGGNDWEGFIQSKLTSFKELHAYLSENQFKPEVTIQKISSSHGIQLDINLSIEQRALIYSGATKFELQSHIPPSFHITLAYNYNPIPKELRKTLQKLLNDNLQFLLRSHAIQLNPPTLCYFNNMTHFIPWNGISYPFRLNKNQVLSPHAFIQNGEEKKPDLKNPTGSCRLM